MRNKIVSAILSVSIVLSVLGINVSAYSLPNAFWKLNDAYSLALDSKDYENIAEYGSKIVNLILNEPQNDQTISIIGSRAYEAAFAYYFMGDYDNSAKYFDIYIPYGEKKNWEDGVRIAREFTKQLPSRLELYQHMAENNRNYGAKNEPDGVLYGQVSEKSQDNESMILLYLEYGNFDEFNWARVIFDKASENNKAIELALNFPNQGDDARRISANDEYLKELVFFLEEYRNVSVFLRIGAEMNIWGNIATPDEFKKAFNTIAQSVRELPHVATVWSVAHTDAWKSAERPYTMHDFYPGNENVDYVGITAYGNKYFEGRRWHGTEEFNEICFKAGYSADPVLMVKEFVEKYGAEKPVIISECGSAYTTKGSVCEEHHEWAADHLRKIYNYIPMVYPEVKLIAYFNKLMPSENNWYDLGSSSQLQEAFNEETQNPWFIQQNNNGKSQTFFKHITDVIDTSGEVTLSAYPRLFGADDIEVDYYLNGEWLASPKQIPYTVTIPESTGILRVTATGNNGGVIDREFRLTNANLFNDMQDLSEIQKKALIEVCERSIILGYEDGSFKPHNTITRAEFATIICRMMGYNAGELCDFDDAKDHWASQYIKACVDEGAINGVGDNLFAADEYVTIEQALKIVTLVCDMANPEAVYPDGFIEVAEENGLMENVDYDNYSNTLSRINAAVIIANCRF